MITTGSITMLAASLGAVLALLVAWGGIRQLRRLLRARCAPLEEALRVYSSASVAMGQHVTAMETELRELRQRLAAVEGAGPRVRLRESVPVEARGVEESSVAEQRLSLLIRSRLGDLRPG